MAYDLGIDVGTSFTAAAVRRPRGAVEVVGLGPIADNIPTIVYLAENGNLLIGDAAARRVALDPSGAAREFKRRMGDPTPLILRTSPFSAEALLRHMVERVVHQVADREGEMPRSTVVTHPANWGPYKLDLFDQALRTADIGPVSRVSEPHAAATAYASQSRILDGSIVAVYDLGGGTFDAAILRKDPGGFSLLGESVGIEHLGGVDFDEAVFHHVRAALGSRWPSDPDDPAVQAPMMHLRRACTEAKELLSSEPAVTIPVMLAGIDTTVPLDRRRFEAMIAPRIDDTISALEAAMTSAGLDRADDFQLVLVGGSSRIPLVGSMLQERFGDVIVRDVDPLYAVAIGAATVAGERADMAATTRNVQSVPAAATTPAVTLPPPERAVPRAAQTTATATPPTPVATRQVPLTAAAEPLVADAEWTPESTTAGPNLTDPRRRRLIGAGLAAILVAGGIGWAATRNGDDSEAAATDSTAAAAPADSAASESAAPNSTAPVDASTIAPAPATDPAGAPVDPPDGTGTFPTSMVRIPAGTYEVGSPVQAVSPIDGSPIQSVDLATFYIDATEVTNADYRGFLEKFRADNLGFPAGWSDQGSFPVEEERFPVVGVPVEYADAYCRSLGKRLPTEAEWEAAASGVQGAARRKYPWGDEDAGWVRPNDVGDTFSVDGGEGNVSAFGVRNMAGNAWEYVADSYDPEVTSRGWQTVRGGSTDFVLDNFSRKAGSSTDYYMAEWVGFRCAASETSPPHETFETVAITPPPAEIDHVLIADGFDHDFHDPTFQPWQTLQTENAFWGYHPLDTFHLNTKGTGATALAVNDAFEMETGVAYTVEAMGNVMPLPRTESGDGFCFGIGVAVDNSEPRQGLFMAACPDQDSPEEAFVKIFVRTSDGQEIEVADRVKFTISRDQMLDFRVDVLGDGNYRFWLNETPMGRVVENPMREQIGEFYDGRNVAMYLQSPGEDSTKVHVHFMRYAVTVAPGG